jgi:hypothetical protein
MITDFEKLNSGKPGNKFLIVLGISLISALSESPGI